MPKRNKSWMASYRHGTRANCGAKGDAAATGKATGEEEYTAYVPVFSWDRYQVSLVGLVRGTSSRPPQEHEGQGLFLPDTCKILSTQKHLQAPIRLSLRLLVPVEEVPTGPAFIDAADVSQSLHRQLMACIPEGDIDIMKGFNKMTSHPSGSLWLDIAKPNRQLEPVHEQQEEGSSQHEWKGREILEVSCSHPPPDLARARVPAMEQVR